MFFTEKEIEFLKKYASVYGGKQCSLVLNRHGHSVYNKCSQLHLKLKTTKILTQDEIEILRNDFSKKILSLDFSINPKELAYFLGYFWADGYIVRNELRLEIVKKDADAIKSIFDKIGYFNIQYRLRKNRKEQACIQCTNAKVSEFLKKLGKYPNSLESHKKVLEFIPKEYHLWFLRGLIDGDGCFYINTKNPSSIQFSISNNYNFDWSYLHQYLIDNFKCDCKIEKRLCENRKNSSSQIRCCGKYKVSNLIKEIYKEDDKIYLPRKYNKVITILEYAKNEKEV